MAYRRLLCSITAIMKKAFIIFSLLLYSSGLFGQVFDNYNWPFQVIYARNTSNQKSVQLNSLDYLNINDTIAVNGFISLVHYSGIPFEISSDTTITIKQLNNAVGSTKKRLANKAYRINIKPLYNSNAREGRKNLLSSRGACFDCNLDLAIINPPMTFSKPILYNEDLHIEWIPSNSKSYWVKLSDSQFNELITTKTDTNMAIIKNISQYHSNPNEHLIITIGDSLKTSRPAFLIKSTQKNYPFGQINTASAALILALRTEMFYLDLPEQTEAYYRLATELSEEEFFDEILQNYLERSKK